MPCTVSIVMLVLRLRCMRVWTDSHRVRACPAGRGTVGDVFVNDKLSAARAKGVTHSVVP